MKPLIGITTNQSANPFGQPTIMLMQSYARAVMQAGGVPVLIPSLVAEDGWDAVYARLNGILFSGGGDISLDFSPGEPHPRIDGVDPARDSVEFKLIQAAAADGKPFPKLLADKGIFPGIKVDKGTVDMPGFPGEKDTEGLDGLRQRLVEYVQLGAKFTKWRAVYTITDQLPSQANIEANAYGLAQFAALTQEAGMVPIVEPEVLMDGDHTLERCEEVTTAVLEAVFAALYDYKGMLEGTLLKPNMVIFGKACPVQASVQEIAEATIRTLKRTVPSALPGVVFLSGGQTPAQATENLSAMNKIGGFPWQLSFSYGRALQDEAIKAWRGDPANVAKAQEKFYYRSKLNGLARYGKYTREMEPVAS